MKKIYLKILVTILIIIGSFSVSFANEDENADYNETKKSIDSYIDNQLEKIDLQEIQKHIKESSIIHDIDLRVFIKDLIKGDRNILDLFDKISANLSEQTMTINKSDNTTRREFPTKIYNFYQNILMP